MLSGIYKIINTTNNKCYVGSAKNFTKRWKRHKSSLAKGTHHNIRLQRSYDKYGSDCFAFHIIEQIPYEKQIIIDRENYWIQKLDSKNNGYNIADASFGDTISNHPNRDKIIEKMSISNKNNWDRLTPEERSSRGMYGENNPAYGRNSHSYGIVNHAKSRLGKTNIEFYGEDKSKTISSNILEGMKRNGGIEKIKEMAKSRTGAKNPFYGKTHSKETIEKIKLKTSGVKPPNTQKYSILGVIYDGLYDAESATGILRSTLYHRCRSKNPKFSEYFKLP